MIPWSSRPTEERTLLNPSFCTSLIWYAATGYTSNGSTRLRFDLAFLVLPFVLHRETRETLPRQTTTSLAVWLQDNPLVPSRVADRARTLLPFTKEALTYGGVHGLLDFVDGTVGANTSWKKKVAVEFRSATDEVRLCASKAEFVGKWFAKAGNPDTVMALIGVRP